MTNQNESDLDRLFEEYLPKLIRLAENRISPQLKAKFDADDVAVSVFGTIVRRVKEGKLQFEDDAEFWRLVVTIAKRKISNKVRHFKTKSRDVDNEIAEAANAIIKSPEPDADEAAALGEILSMLMDRLNDQEKTILEKRIEGCTFQEIADHLGVVERTPRRKMKVIQERLMEILGDESIAEDDTENN